MSQYLGFHKLSCDVSQFVNLIGVSGDLLVPTTNGKEYPSRSCDENQCLNHWPDIVSGILINAHIGLQTAETRSRKRGFQTYRQYGVFTLLPREYRDRPTPCGAGVTYCPSLVVDEPPRIFRHHAIPPCLEGHGLYGRSSVSGADFANPQKAQNEAMRGPPTVLRHILASGNEEQILLLNGRSVLLHSKLQKFLYHQYHRPTFLVSPPTTLVLVSRQR